MTTATVDNLDSPATNESWEWLQETLRNNTATVTFVKKNGEQRVMTCTLQQDIIPQQHQPKPLAEGETPRKRSDANLSVWDLNAQGWRSFVLANVTKVELQSN